MRLSVLERENLTEEETRVILNCTVFLDGKEIKDAIIADEEKGYIVRHRRDAQGNFIVVDDEIKTERIMGHVEIRSPNRITPRA